MLNQAREHIGYIQLIGYIHGCSVEYPTVICKEDWSALRPLLAKSCAEVANEDEDFTRKGHEAMSFYNSYFDEKRK